MFAAARRLLFALPPERAHDVALGTLDQAMRLGFAKRLIGQVRDPRRLMGITFANAVGLAAGLDKDGDHINGLSGLGFGFLELGTVTPRPQPGNPTPRLFRLVEHEALINRLGFNNQGVDHLVSRIEAARAHIPIGINIGKNRDTPLEAAAADYLHCLEAVHAHADYVVINLSSPNTPGLRRLQEGQELTALVEQLIERRDALGDASGRRVPLLVKIAPDLDDDPIRALVETLRECGVDGITATNTTVARPGVESHPQSEEAGGLSGAPLRDRATAVVRLVRETAGPDLPIIAVGGILTPADAVEKMQAGADLVQIYTGFIYRGPTLIRDAAKAIATTVPAPAGIEGNLS